MARGKVTLPHLVLRSLDIRAFPADGWELVGLDEKVAGTTLRDGEAIESWDGLSRLAFRRSYRLPVDAAARLGLVEESVRYSFAVTAVTAGGLHRDMLFRRDFGAELQLVDVLVRPQSARLARELRLVAHLAITSAEAADNPLAPTSAGARIWEESFRFQLEGGRGRIPMEAVSFRTTFSGQGFENALFHVEFAPYPELDIEETVRVYINADNPSFVAAAERRDPAASTLLWDGVIRRLVKSAVLDDALVDTDAYTDGSMGSNIRRWLKQAFPSMKLASIRSLAISTPAIFEAILDSWSGLGWRAFSSIEQE